MTDELESLKQQLQDALPEIDKLREENAQLKQSATSNPHQLLEERKRQYRLPGRGPNPTIGGREQRCFSASFRSLVRKLSVVYFCRNDARFGVQPVTKRPVRIVSISRTYLSRRRNQRRAEGRSGVLREFWGQGEF